jgi:hypothetical protein
LDGMSHEFQRKGRRLAVRLPYSLVVGDGGRELSIPAESINVSKTGIRVKTASELFLGQTVEVVLMEGTPHPVVARVVWVDKPNGPNHYEFGLEYISLPRPV